MLEQSLCVSGRQLASQEWVRKRLLHPFLQDDTEHLARVYASFIYHGCDGLWTLEADPNWLLLDETLVHLQSAVWKVNREPWMLHDFGDVEALLRVRHQNLLQQVFALV